MTPTHFIIKLVGVSIAAGIRRSGDFRFVEKYRALVYDGEEIPIARHNDLVPRVLEKYKDHMPRLPQVVLLDLAEAPSAPVEPPLSPAPPVEVVSKGVSDEGGAGDSTPAEQGQSTDPTGSDPAPAPSAAKPDAPAKKAAKKAPAKKAAKEKEQPERDPTIP